MVPERLLVRTTPCFECHAGISYGQECACGLSEPKWISGRTWGLEIAWPLHFIALSPNTMCVVQQRQVVGPTVAAVDIVSPQPATHLSALQHKEEGGSPETTFMSTIRSAPVVVPGDAFEQSPSPLFPERARTSRRPAIACSCSVPAQLFSTRSRCTRGVRARIRLVGVASTFIMTIGVLALSVVGACVGSALALLIRSLCHPRQSVVQLLWVLVSLIAFVVGCICGVVLAAIALVYSRCVSQSGDVCAALAFIGVVVYLSSWLPAACL